MIGGGPAGAAAARALAERGIQTRLYHADPPHGEKPCGGGVTVKANPGAAGWTALGVASNSIERIRVHSPRGRVVEVDGNGAALFTVVSRGELDAALRRRAEEAGARIERKRVVSVRVAGDGVDVRTSDAAERFDAVIGADGAFSRVRASLGLTLPQDLCPAVDEIVEGIDPAAAASIAFFADLTGYLWVFPGPKFASAGLVARPGELGASALRARVRAFLGRHHPGARVRRSTGWVIPAPRMGPLDRLGLSGPRFALAGDAAGLVDPLTGEGISYALASGELAGRLAAAGALETYGRALDDGMGGELRAARRYVDRYFRPRFLEALLWMARHHGAARGVLADVLAGRQRYEGLAARARGSLWVLGTLLRWA